MLVSSAPWTVARILCPKARILFGSNRSPFLWMSCGFWVHLLLGIWDLAYIRRVVCVLEESILPDTNFWVYLPNSQTKRRLLYCISPNNIPEGINLATNNFKICVSSNTRCCFFQLKVTSKWNLYAKKQTGVILAVRPKQPQHSPSS